MTESEILRLIRRACGISKQHDEQATQPDSVTADNYVRVVAEVMRRDGIELNGVDMRNIRTRVLELLAYRRRNDDSAHQPNQHSNDRIARHRKTTNMGFLL